MMKLYNDISQQCSKFTTETYSTSFSSAIKLLQPHIQQPVFNIYGFVRLADEIVDTFHEHDKRGLLQRFKQETFVSIEQKISLNPILQSFQRTVNEYSIPAELIEAFFQSMEMDLHKAEYSSDEYKTYIYGSAEVVGLMCLQVFCNGNKDQYENLKPFAQSLGAAFQKVNFLRDLKADYTQLNRTYFPDVDFTNFSVKEKLKIEQDIELDFEHAYKGIAQLPLSARFGVYVAFKYYQQLFKKIKKTRAKNILKQRISIPGYLKSMIVLNAGLKYKLNLI